MTPTETASILRQFNEWRRGADGLPPHRNDITEAIDAAVEMIDRLEESESDGLEQAHLNGVGSEREAALMAKLEAAKKDIALKERVIDSLGAELNAVAKKRDALQAKIDKLNVQNSTRLKALLAIADWNSAWGPFPEKNEHWRAMAIVTAREATKAFEQGEQK